MSDPSNDRARRLRRRRHRAAVALAAGLTFGAIAVATPVANAVAAPTTSADVVGLRKGVFGNNVRALQDRQPVSHRQGHRRVLMTVRSSDR